MNLEICFNDFQCMLDFEGNIGNGFDIKTIFFQNIYKKLSFWLFNHDLGKCRALVWLKRKWRKYG